jgi:hypothetical protein
VAGKIISKVMLQLWCDATKYVASDAVHDRRWKSNEPPTMEWASMEMRRNMMEAVNVPSRHNG